MERQAGVVATALVLFLLQGCNRQFLPSNPEAFWHRKQPDQWTEAECYRMFRGNPWASGEASRFDGRWAKGSPWMVGVLWESAPPLIAARRRIDRSAPTADDFSGYYVVTIEGVDPAWTKMAGPKDYHAQLIPASRQPIDCSRLEVLRRSIRYYFPNTDPIRMEDLVVTFKTKTGVMEVQTKFDLPDMVWNGKLAI